MAVLPDMEVVLIGDLYVAMLNTIIAKLEHHRADHLRVKRTDLDAMIEGLHDIKAGLRVVKAERVEDD